MRLGIYEWVMILKIILKDKAIERLNELNVKDEKDKALRIRVLNYSWCGAVYGVTLDKSNENDIIMDAQGFKICVNKNLDNIECFTIDYSKNPLSKGFKVYTD